MRRNAGMSLILAIFLLLVLAALGAIIASVATKQQADSAMDLEGSRAYHAARAGLDYGAYQVVSNIANCTGTTALALPSASFNDFTSVSITYVPSLNHNEAGAIKNLCTITANACNQPGAGGVCPNPTPAGNYMERELQLTVINPP